MFCQGGWISCLLIWLPTEESSMIWTTPKLEEICIGMEINGYFPAEF